MKKSRWGALSAGIFIFLSTSTSAVLIDLGGGLIYDDKLDITWSQPDVVRSWDDANTWAAGLTLGGVSGWRLPYISVAAGAGPFTGSPIDCSSASEAACRDNELGYMFYQNLSGTLGQPILTSGDPDLLALFPTLENFFYWSGKEFDFTFAWLFGFREGDQFVFFRDISYHSWAVHPGNVGLLDSDGDGLSYVDELELGTDPFDSDSDDDGILDGSDPDVLADVIAALPLDPSVFANSGDPRGQRNAILSRLIDIQSDIASEDYEEAIRALQNLRRLVDGCGISADRNDWITDCEVQVEVRRLIDLLITNLEAA